MKTRTFRFAEYGQPTAVLINRAGSPQQSLARAVQRKAPRPI